MPEGDLAQNIYHRAVLYFASLVFDIRLRWKMTPCNSNRRYSLVNSLGNPFFQGKRSRERGGFTNM